MSAPHRLDIFKHGHRAVRQRGGGGGGIRWSGHKKHMAHGPAECEFCWFNAPYAVPCAVHQAHLLSYAALCRAMLRYAALLRAMP